MVIRPLHRAVYSEISPAPMPVNTWPHSFTNLLFPGQNCLIWPHRIRRSCFHSLLLPGIRAHQDNYGLLPRLRRGSATFLTETRNDSSITQLDGLWYPKAKTRFHRSGDVDTAYSRCYRLPVCFHRAYLVAISVCTFNERQSRFLRSNAWDLKGQEIERRLGIPRPE